MPKFVKKPVVIEAVQLNWRNWGALCEFLGDMIDEENPARLGKASDTCGEVGPYINLTIPTLEGDHLALHGDWIIRGVEGEFYPCKPSVLRRLTIRLKSNNNGPADRRSHGKDQGLAWHGKAWQGKAGIVARQGKARHGMARIRAWLGLAWQGWAWHGKDHGLARLGLARHGMARIMARHGWAWRGTAWQGSWLGLGQVRVRQGMAWHGLARHGKDRGWAWQVRVRQGMARIEVWHDRHDCVQRNRRSGAFRTVD